MVIIRTTKTFSAAHRQFGDPDECGFLHGHNWDVNFVIGGEQLDEIGYLINFRVLKEICQKYDHKVVLLEYDPLADVLEDQHQRVVRLPINPTCENLAGLIRDDVLAYLKDRNREPNFVIITIWEAGESQATQQWQREEVTVLETQ